MGGWRCLGKWWWDCKGEKLEDPRKKKDGKCRDGYSELGWFLKFICTRNECPKTHQSCAGFLCIPKKDKVNDGSCPGAIMDLVFSKIGNIG